MLQRHKDRHAQITPTTAPPITTKKEKHLAEVQDFFYHLNWALTQEAYAGRINNGTIDRHIQTPVIETIGQVAFNNNFSAEVYDDALRVINSVMSDPDKQADPDTIAEDISEFDSLCADWQLFAIMDHAHSVAMVNRTTRRDGHDRRTTPRKAEMEAFRIYTPLTSIKPVYRLVERIEEATSETMTVAQMRDLCHFIEDNPATDVEIRCGEATITVEIVHLPS